MYEDAITTAGNIPFLYVQQWYQHLHTNIVKVIVMFFLNVLTFWRRNYFFLILAHPVYKM